MYQDDYKSFFAPFLLMIVSSAVKGENSIPFQVLERLLVKLLLLECMFLLKGLKLL